MDKKKKFNFKDSSDENKVENEAIEDNVKDTEEEIKEPEQKVAENKSKIINDLNNGQGIKRVDA